VVKVVNKEFVKLEWMASLPNDAHFGDSDSMQNGAKRPPR
jgi:hypothetical protein